VRAIQTQPNGDSLSLTDGRTITLLERLGRGSLGTVYRGTIESGWGVRRPVAVKMFAVAADLDPVDAMHDLARIARRAVGVRHPSIIPILEVDRTGGFGDPCQPFLVSELVEGESLASLLEGWRNDGLRVPVDFAMFVTLRTAEALGAALFSDGVDGSLTDLVHGNLSPCEILISNQGEIRVGDFGQSILERGHTGVRMLSRQTHTAPEIVAGGIPNSRSDVFSLGVILHELLLGPRFAAGTSPADAARMLRDGLVHEPLLPPSIPRSLREIIDRALCRNPMGRYAHARAMAFDLRREMLRLGLIDAQTCVRHAVVGWCEVHQPSERSRRASGIIATGGESAREVGER
jgi:serine/threonine-protein kinase